MKFTDLETRVFNLIATESMSGGLLDVPEIAEALNLTVPTVKGVIGSLTKKGKVDTDPGDGDIPPCIWPIHPKYGPCFWGDLLTEEEFQKELIQ